jgi:vitamin K-dependent gamma-carboxylase
MMATERVRSARLRSALGQGLECLNRSCDGAGLGACRALLGGLLLFSVVRFWAYGWIEQVYVRPAFHFTYLGFAWVRPWPGWGMYAHFALMAGAAFCLCIGAFSRVSALVFCLAFTYAELIEKASYLNHYYFVSLACLLLACVPSGASLSIDGLWRRRRGLPEQGVSFTSYALLRAQLGLLYFFAGFAKLDRDWLVDAQPLGSWLALHADVPLLGGLLAQAWFAHVASFAGAAYDLSIVAWLLYPSTRRVAYAAVVAFHIGVWLLFPIGMFSWVMIAATTIFFDPGWPRTWLARLGLERDARSNRPASEPLGALRGAAFGAYLLVQLLVPLRFLLYPGNVNWHEQGFRFSWRVMLVEKAGQVEFTVLTGTGDRRYVVYPRDALTPLQYKMMCTQPDMILEYAQHIKHSFEARGLDRVRVYADAWASLNGRPRQRLIDPEADLGSAAPSLRQQSWILPLEKAGRSPSKPSS